MMKLTVFINLITKTSYDFYIIINNFAPVPPLKSYYLKRSCFLSKYITLGLGPVNIY